MYFLILLFLFHLIKQLTKFVMYDVNIMSILREDIDISSTFQNTQISINMVLLSIPPKNATSRHWQIPTTCIYGYLNYMHNHSNFAWYQIRTNYIYVVCLLQRFPPPFRTTPIIIPNVVIMHLILYAIKTTSRLYKNILTG